jgi:MFS family permease
MRLPDPTLFRNAAFVRYWIARSAFVLGWQVQTIALLWQAPQIVLRAGGTEQQAVFAIGLVGLFQFVPLFLLSLFGGHIADRYDRKTILLLCFAAKLLIALVLCIGGLSAPGGVQLGWLYAGAAVAGAVNAFQPAAAQSLLPTIVSRADLPRAIPLNSLAFTISSVLGPALGGVALAVGGADGPSVAYGVAAALIAFGMIALATLKAPRRGPMPARPTLTLIKEGLAYVWNNKIVLGAISLDLVVVLLAGAQALVPFFADRVLNAGEVGAGWLRGGIALGGAATALVIAFFPLRRRVGAWMFGSTFVFAAATTVFGLSTSFTLSFLALAIAGAADMISVQVRQSLIQLATPEPMLGRVAAVSFVFISASNELGDFEAGVVGSLLGPQLGVALGGVAALAASLLWMRLFPALARADTFEDEAIMRARRESEARP